MKILNYALILAFAIAACSSSGAGDGADDEGECTVDGDCALGEVCEANACVPAPLECEADDDCGDLEICTDNECVTVECKVDGDCALGTCEANSCVDSCIGDHDQTVQCENDMWAAVRVCLACIQFGASCPDGVVPGQTPIAECLNVALGLSFECGTCYQDLGVCSITCSTRCSESNGQDPDSCECWDCLDAVCGEAFEACALFNLADGVPACSGPRECTP